LAASWDAMLETMKKEGITPLRPLTVTTIYTEIAPADARVRRETVSLYGFQPAALLPDLLKPGARKQVDRQQEDDRFMDEAVKDSIGWNTIVNRITDEKDPFRAPDLDVHTWITYLVDRQREGKAEKDVVTRDLRFTVHDGEIHTSAVKR
jgi:hypothetical protein